MSSQASMLKPVLWERLFERESAPNLSLQGRVRQMLVSAILSGHLPPGTPVPSSRQLADQLRIARNTVVFAYQQLVSEGYLVSRERSGHFVCDSVMQGHSGPAPEAAAALPDADTPQRVRWDERLRFRPSRQRNITKPQDWQKQPYPFVYGQFDPDLFPTAEWRECCTKALSVLDIRSWAPDLITHDDPALIEQIRTQVLPRRGVWADAEEIVITVGAQHALYLLADLLVNEDTVVGMEDPGYPDARNIFASHTRNLLPMPVDERGLCTGTHLLGCDYLFVTPGHQCPTTVTLSMERRESLLALARQADSMIIEDDFESESRWGEGAIPALKSQDRDGRVIYVGSLAKSFAPGLRIGYIVAPRELTRELRALRRLMLRHPSAYIQRAFSLFISLGHHHSLLRKQSQAYQRRGAELTQALARYLPDFKPTPITGSSSCWLEGPPWLNAADLSEAALAEGVVVEPGDVFFMNGADAPRNFLRVGFTSIRPELIGPGIERLAQVVRRYRLQAAA
ncbi:MocR-like pyridoxine biosynthesis transcription factor PdxR [Achromobacter kerstersii]|uniref:HTH-type transcriptional regulator TauR n=1 Tax=Achromobacter kerstersii TaxID=1353890 RepID=A0A6S6Z0P4_9BURK|nr:PLP-dependent aminotransferase family protein [Achromobacter kerstersii]CAB3654281.1 HTH-type transcriptional regulator TauR [Achromobacter kerstersii]